MSFSTLPPSVLAIVIGKLDTKSVYNLHAADIVCLQGLVTECQFSANTLATAKSLKTNFFSAVSPYVRVLNLCGVPDLDLSSLFDALTNMENLIDLNVMYTNVGMTDFLQIVKVRPTLKNLAMKFYFSDEFISQLNDDVLLDYQKAFEGFENINFIGPLESRIHGSLAVRMLERADLQSLKFTYNGMLNENYTSDRDRWSDRSNMKTLKVTLFQWYILQPYHNRTSFEPPIFDVMDFTKYEILVIKANEDDDPVRRYTVFATQLLKDVICRNFSVKVECLSDWPEFFIYSLHLRSEREEYLKKPFSEIIDDKYHSPCEKCKENGENVTPFMENEREGVFMFWDKERTTIKEFLQNIPKIVKQHFIYNLDSYSKIVPAEFQWYCVDPTMFNSPITIIRNSYRFMKSLTTNSKTFVELDCGSAFKDKKDVKLDVMFDFDVFDSVPRMINNCNLLGKISHLFVHGRDVNFDLDFFNNLFQNCHSLVTLQIVNWGSENFDAEYLQLMPKCSTLKNIMIVARFQISELFSYLSECRTLENIYLNDSSHSELVIDNFADPTDLFSKCDNLYNIVITLVIFSSEAEQLIEIYKKIRSDLGKEAINIMIRYFRYAYLHPYLGVFNMYQLKPM